MSTPVRTLLACAGLIVSIAAGVCIGAADLAPREVLASLINRVPGIEMTSQLSSVQEALLWEIRVPRVVLAGLVGSTLAVAGAGYQGVFRNPLVDPYLLGAAAGAGLGATLILVLIPSESDTSALVPIAAFAGAIGGVLASYLLGIAADGARSTASLVLAGVATSSFLTALQTFLLQQRSEALRSVYSWILGGLGGSDWKGIAMVLPYMVIASSFLLWNARNLDVLSNGDDKAATLGLRPSRVRLVVVLAASLGTAAAVAVSGLIGFVGIVVPHMIRRLFGSRYTNVLPLCIVVGAAFFILVDLVARTIVSPAELPAGVVTAFLGAPFFAVLLRFSRRSVV